MFDHIYRKAVTLLLADNRRKLITKMERKMERDFLVRTLLFHLRRNSIGRDMSILEFFKNGFTVVGCTAYCRSLFSLTNYFS